MTLRLMLLIVVLTLSAGTGAQSRSNIESFGKLQILEVGSAELSDVLQLVGKKIASLGFADKGLLPEVMNQDVVVADQIVFERGKTLTLAPKAINDRNLILFIAHTIRVTGESRDPVRIFWDRYSAGPVREPVRLGKAAAGLAGDREGGDGKPGANGVVGNRGFRGQDSPSVVLVALKFEAMGRIQFDLRGQEGGPGGAGQDGGDGGPGRPGRPGFLSTSSIGITIKQSSPCEPAIPGGNGGKGGDGGAGAIGGLGGAGGNVLLIGGEINGDLVRRLLDQDSVLIGGKGGPKGLHGFGGKGGAGAPAVPGAEQCEPSNAGTDGFAGEGRELTRALVDPTSTAPDGDAGTVVFSRLNESQARSLGLINEPK